METYSRLVEGLVADNVHFDHIIFSGSATRLFTHISKR